MSAGKPNSEIVKLLRKKIENGEYNLDEKIVPQTLTKIFVKDGKIQSEEISVSGRKFSLIQICKRSITETQPLNEVNNR